MAYIFPTNPSDGQLYPVPAVAGSLQYQWSAASNVWLIYSPLGVQSVTGILPLVVSNGSDNAVVSILPATINTAGSMSAPDKAKLDSIPADAGVGTVTSITAGDGLIGGTITTAGTIGVLPANTTTIGGVIVGANIDVDTQGAISIPTARFGVTSINVGAGLVSSPAPITNVGTISASLANRLTVGAVRVGNGINVTPDGTISVGGALANAAILAYASVECGTSSPPTFTILESFNISALVWAGTADEPRVQIYYQTPLANAGYGLIYGAYSKQLVPRAQTANVINMSYKDTNTAAFQLSTTYTYTWSNTNVSSTITYNNWGNQGLYAGIQQFDIAIIDTPVF